MIDNFQERSIHYSYVRSISIFSLSLSLSLSIGMVTRGRSLRRQLVYLPGIEVPDGWHRVRGFFQHQHEQIFVDELRLFLPLGSR